MDYYSTLGVSRNATLEEIKKAYRKQAMRHHPDRNNGDDSKFKQIQSAYDVLSDPQKKQMYDMGADPNNSQNHGFRRGPFEFQFEDEMSDVFRNFGFGAGFQQRSQRNKHVHVAVEITLEDVLNGKQINAEIKTAASSKKIVTIDIPPGIENGQHIRYQGMGENTIQGVPAGDLIVDIFVKDHKIFRRDKDTLHCIARIDVWTALLGGSVDIKTLDGRNLNITVPAGVQPDTVLSCKNEGLPNIRSRQRGNLHVKIKVEMPKNLSADQIKKIKEIKNGL